MPIAATATAEPKKRNRYDCSRSKALADHVGVGHPAPAEGRAEDDPDDDRGDHPARSHVRASIAKLTPIAVAKKVAVATSAAGEISETPESPLPEVQPPASLGAVADQHTGPEQKRRDRDTAPEPMEGLGHPAVAVEELPTADEGDKSAAAEDDADQEPAADIEAGAAQSQLLDHVREAAGDSQPPVEQGAAGDHAEAQHRARGIPGGSDPESPLKG